MPSTATHRHHPLARAGTAAEHFILRHFGFRLMRPESKESPPRGAARASERREP
jgi:hypothetical protein